MQNEAYQDHRQIISNYSFADAEYLGFARLGDDLLVHVKLWHGQKIAITFKGVIALQEFEPGDIAGFWENETSPFWTAVMDQYYTITPDAYEHRSFVFTDLSDGVRLEVIAESWQIKEVR